MGGEGGGDRLGDRVQVDLEGEPALQVGVRVKGSRWLPMASGRGGERLQGANGEEKLWEAGLAGTQPSEALPLSTHTCPLPQ